MSPIPPFHSTTLFVYFIHIAAGTGGGTQALRTGGAAGAGEAPVEYLSETPPAGVVASFV